MFRCLFKRVCGQGRCLVSEWFFLFPSLWWTSHFFPKIWCLEIFQTCFCMVWAPGDQLVQGTAVLHMCWSTGLPTGSPCVSFACASMPPLGQAQLFDQFQCNSNGQTLKFDNYIEKSDDIVITLTRISISCPPPHLNFLLPVPSPVLRSHSASAGGGGISWWWARDWV